MKANFFNLRLVISLTIIFFLLNIIQVSAQDVYKVNTQRLNMRDLPSTKGRLIGSLTQGMTVTVENIENGWAMLSYEGKTCYVSAKYLLKVETVEPKETERVPLQEDGQKVILPADSEEVTTVVEQIETVTEEENNKRLISGSFILFSGEGHFTDRLNGCVGWHYITINGWGFDFVTRWVSTKYGNRNIDIGPNYSYKLMNNLYVTGALCLSPRLQGMPDVKVSSSGKIKEETKYKSYIDFVVNARVSYELRKLTMSAGFVYWAPEFKFNDGYSSNGFQLSLLFPI